MPRIRSKQIIGQTPVRPEHLATKEYVDSVLNKSAVDKRRLAYFHSLSKVMTNANENIYENKYKASHNVRMNEIWTDDIAFASNFQDAYTESLTNDSVLYFNRVILDEIYGSDGQTYCYIEDGTFKDDTYPIIERGDLTNGSTFIRPFIAPEDIFDDITNEISYGYKLMLYYGEDATSGEPGTEIPESDEWYVDYYSGTVHFSEGNTPVDLGFGAITASFFKYNGSYISDTFNETFKSAIFEDNKIIFNKNQSNEQELDLSTLVLTNTVSSISLNDNKELVVYKNNGTNYKLDLSVILNESINNVTFNDADNILTFYRDSVSYLSVNINDILLPYNNSFVDVDVDGEDLVFTNINGETRSVSLYSLQDRSAFNYVKLTDNILSFKTQSGDETEIDLSYLNGGGSGVSGISDVTINENIITFYKNGASYLSFDVDEFVNIKFGDINPVSNVTLNNIDNSLVFTHYDGTNESIDIKDLQDRTAFNTVSFDNNVLKFIKQNGDETEIDFNGFVDINKLTDVQFSDNEISFYKNGSLYSTVNIKDIVDNSFGEYNPIVNVEVDTITNEIVYTYFNNTEYRILISDFQDKSVFNTVSFDNNILSFTSLSGDETEIDFSSFISNNNLSDVQIVDDEITFYKNGELYSSLNIKNIVDSSFNEYNPVVSIEVDPVTNELVYKYFDNTENRIQLSDFQDKSVFNSVSFNNNILSFTALSGDETEIDFNGFVDINKLTDVQYSNNELSFYKNGTLYTTINIKDVVDNSFNEYNPIVNVEIDNITNEIVYKYFDNTETRIQITDLQDRTAINTVSFDNNILSFVAQNGDETEIDFSNLVNTNNLTEVQVVNDELTFYKNGALYLSLDVKSIAENTISDYNPIISVDIDNVTNELVYTYLDNTQSRIQITDLQDRTAINTVSFDNNILSFVAQNGDETEIDFTGFISENIITDVQVNSGEISFFKNGTLYSTINVNNLIDNSFNEYNPVVNVEIDTVTNEIVYTYFDNTQSRLQILDLQNQNVVSSVSFENNTLKFEKLSGDITTIDITPVSLEVGITDVVYDDITKSVTYYKEGELYLVLDLKPIIESTIETNGYINVQVIKPEGEIGTLQFTRADGTTETIELDSLQDRSAFNNVELTNNQLIFRTQASDETIIDLNELNFGDLVDPDIVIGASFNETLNVLTLNQIGGDDILIDLSSLSGGGSGVEGAISILSSANINMTAKITTSSNNLACNIAILSPNIDTSNVLVFINGIQVFVGDDIDCECYFSDDSGVTKKTLNNIKLGDKLYWNYVSGQPVAGYELSTVDRITFTYLNSV